MKKLERDSRGRVILAEGEVTGHAHAIEAPGAELFALDDNSEDKLLRLPSRAKLRHEEHKALWVPAGDLTVSIKRQYDPEGTWSRVED